MPEEWYLSDWWRGEYGVGLFFSERNSQCHMTIHPFSYTLQTGAYPSYHRVRGKVHPVQIASLMQG